MTKLWNFFENLDEIVYVSDVDTYDLVYMNRKAREMYGLDSLADISALKCYEFLQNCSCPCSICSNDFLKPGDFYEWTYYNPVLNKPFALKDTIIEENGRRYRMEIAIDMSIQAKQKQTIKEYSNNETLVNEGLRLALSADSPNQAIHILLEYLGKTLQSERVYIFEENTDGSYDNTYEWCAGGIVPQKDNLQQVPFEAVELWFKAFRNNENVIITDLELTRESDPLAYEYLKPQGIHSLVVSPLIVNKKIIGFYGVDNPPGEHLGHISTMFQVVGHFMVSMLKRRELVKRLENLSYYDQLTGAKNRHAMDEYIENVSIHKSIGILYGDVMGLKKLNDTKGHSAGDTLLINAFISLAQHFSDYSIFRIGGDEFLVLCSGIPKEDMLARTQALRTTLDNNLVGMALGCVWEPHCDNELPKLIARADDLMYKEKRARYAAQASE